jgi:hypothetical protein
MPVPSDKKPATLIFDSDTAGAQNPLSNSAWKASSVVDLGKHNRCALQFFYDAHASGTANRFQAIVKVANLIDGETTPPVAGTDVWSVLTRADELTTDAVLTGTVVSGEDTTIAPAWDWQTLRQTAFDSQVMTAGTHKQRFGIVVDVSGWRYLLVEAKELGEATNIGVLKIRSSLSG